MATQSPPSEHEPPPSRLPPDESGSNNDNPSNTSNTSNTNNANNRLSSIWKRFLGKSSTTAAQTTSSQITHGQPSREASPSGGLLRRASRRVVPGLPRAKTFKRQQSEVRERLEPVKPTPAERRAVSVDRRGQHSSINVASHSQQFPRASAPEILGDTYSTTAAGSPPPVQQSPTEERQASQLDTINAINRDDTTGDEDAHQYAQDPPMNPSAADAHSITTSLYDTMIQDDLEHKWILNLSMHFRDKSKREKFFVTYRENESSWRRVTVSLDYREAPDDSLEKDLLSINIQRDKSAKIYEAIRESLSDIQFYDTVTNLKLQTTEGRLHVHVVEDVNEIIRYPTTRMVQHLRCRRIRETDLDFESHMSGFVYKVRVDGQTLIKKEIPGPDTIDEFLYEVNALNSLKFSPNVIPFYGVVVDEHDEHVKGLLIDYAGKGALIDIIYDAQEHGPECMWHTRKRWARQIVQGLSDIHEAGFVQGDFTLSNIVIDDDDNAKIIDINRRGCPVGWEPPEATPLIGSNQRISMYIGVKSDLYQLGMVLWALATMEDEPEAHRRPLSIDPEIDVPLWYRRMVDLCLSDNPRARPQAATLISMFPELSSDEECDGEQQGSISVDDGYTTQRYLVDGYERNGRPIVRTVTPQSEWYYGHRPGIASPGLSEDAYYYPPRGRSPPSPLPSNHEDFDAPHIRDNVVWTGDDERASSISDVSPDEVATATPRNSRTIAATAMVGKADGDVDAALREMQAESAHGQALETESHNSDKIAPVDDHVASPKIVIDGAEASPHKSATDISLEEGSAAIGNITEDFDSFPHAEAKQDRQTDVPATEQRDEDSTEEGPTPNYIPTASSSSQEAAPEAIDALAPKFDPLAGVGTAYGTQSDFRHPICSDEDLGITTTTATASQNVASQA